MTNLVACMAVVGVISCSASHDPAPAPGPAPTLTFQQTSDAALQTLQTVFYQDGFWNLCTPNRCGILTYDDFDWGADSLTAALYLRWSIDKDASIPPTVACS